MSTPLELLHPEHLPNGKIRAAIFDFDGTFSTLRCGWEKVMRKLMLELISGGNEYDKVGHFANSLSTENSPSHTTVPVGQFISNELGLYDMSGNVSELCYDLYAEYDLQDQVDPIGPSWTEKKYHVERGGSFEEFWSTVYDRSIWYDSKSNGVRLILKR